MKADREAANKKIDELTKQMYDNQIAALKSEIKAAQDMATNSGGDGKGVLDVATEAGENLKEGAMAIAREVKESMDSGMNNLKEILTNRPSTPVTTVNRSPQEITAIIEEENALLGSLGEP
jgi:phage-related tail protein